MSVKIKIKNGFNVPKIGYIRYKKGAGIKDISESKIISPTSGDDDDSYQINFAKGQEKEFLVKAGDDVISASFWLDTWSERKWMTDRPHTDITGPMCDQAEFTIDSKGTGQNVVSYDISAVEGICGSYKMYFKPDNGQKSDELTCNPSMISAFSKWDSFVPSDKNNPDYTKDHRSIISCPGGDCEQKKKCHDYVNKHSYNTSKGYCKWLYDKGCQGYCWAYDEMKCPKGKKCIFDSAGNPMYEVRGVEGQKCVDCQDCLPGINDIPNGVNTTNYKGAHKTVDGSPTNPQAPRVDGTLYIEFGPLGNSVKKSTKTLLIILILTLIIIGLFVFLKLKK